MFFRAGPFTGGSPGIYRSVAGVISVVVDTNTPVPGFPSETFSFISGTQGFGLSDGAISFLGRGTSPDSSGVYSTLGGSVIKVLNNTDMLEGKSVGLLGTYGQGISGTSFVFNVGSHGAFLVRANFAARFPPLCQRSDPIDGIDEAITEIDEIMLDPGTAETLVEKLEEAKDKLASDDRHDARSKLSDFVSELEAAEEVGSLATGDANVLLNKAGCILATMRFEGSFLW